MVKAMGVIVGLLVMGMAKASVLEDAPDEVRRKVCCELSLGDLLSVGGASKSCRRLVQERQFLRDRARRQLIAPLPDRVHWQGVLCHVRTFAERKLGWGQTAALKGQSQPGVVTNDGEHFVFSDGDLVMLLPLGGDKEAVGQLVRAGALAGEGASAPVHPWDVNIVGAEVLGRELVVMLEQSLGHYTLDIAERLPGECAAQWGNFEHHTLRPVHLVQVLGFRVSRSRQRVVLYGRDYLGIYDRNAKSIVGESRHHALSRCKLDRFGTLFGGFNVSGRLEVYLLDLDREEGPWSRGVTEQGKSLHVQAFTFSEAGQHLVTAAGEGQLHIWEVEREGYLVPIGRLQCPDVTAPFDDITLSGDGLTLVLIFRSGSVMLWDLDLAERKILNMRRLPGIVPGDSYNLDQRRGRLVERGLQRGLVLEGREGSLLKVVDLLSEDRASYWTGFLEYLNIMRQPGPWPDLEVF